MRGKKRALENVERCCLEAFDAKRLAHGEYDLKVPYSSEKDLDKRVSDLLADITSEADDRHCFSESEARMEGTGRSW
ncbi:hypothetical protein [Methyloterricola oryzae]|uniref:hypothetical protein n=1 Tax=Methyloterricola oryzae TaxID=1495050 RepID=UPI001910EA0F|nr:hypothetical protein [Methyloterricola oryzae]